VFYFHFKLNNGPKFLQKYKQWKTTKQIERDYFSAWRVFCICTWHDRVLRLATQQNIIGQRHAYSCRNGRLTVQKCALCLFWR